MKRNIFGLIAVARLVIALALISCLALAQVVAGSTTVSPLVALVAPAQPAFDWLAFFLGLLPVLIPAVIAIVSLTKWGRTNKEALDETNAALGHVVDAVGLVRRTLNPQACLVTKIMADKEQEAAPAVVARWKAAVAKWDPKKN